MAQLVHADIEKDNPYFSKRKDNKVKNTTQPFKFLINYK